jgi:hypothetical protein
MYFLSIIAIFKNEENIMSEWIEHYLAEGVDHFYLINNGSNDDFKRITKPYEQKDIIEIVNDATKYSQVSLYNKYYLNKIKKETNWIIVADLDEFLYSRKDYKTISQYLSKLPNDVGQVFVPWKMFGSSGYLHSSRSCCIDNFKWRFLYNQNIKNLTKSIINTKYLENIGIHSSNVAIKSKQITSDGKIFGQNEMNISEEILQNSAIHCNHYAIQSFEWFKRVKMTRGDATTKMHDKVRNISYFNSYDDNNLTEFNPIDNDNDNMFKEKIMDDELANKRNKFKVFYGNIFYYDVTSFVYKYFFDRRSNNIVIGSRIVLNDYFGNPVEGKEKYLVVRTGNTLKVYPEFRKTDVVIQF